MSEAFLTSGNHPKDEKLSRKVDEHRKFHVERFGSMASTRATVARGRVLLRGRGPHDDIERLGTLNAKAECRRSSNSSEVVVGEKASTFASIRITYTSKSYLGKAEAKKMNLLDSPESLVFSMLGELG